MYKAIIAIRRVLTMRCDIQIGWLFRSQQTGNQMSGRLNKTSARVGQHLLAPCLVGDTMGGVKRVWALTRDKSDVIKNVKINHFAYYPICEQLWYDCYI